MLNEAEAQLITTSVDAYCGEPPQADAAIIFGTRLTEPAHLAADLYNDGRTSLIVVTGGASPIEPGHQEADIHAQILNDHHVPHDLILRDHASRHTIENVTHAADLIHRRLGRPPESVIAVVKWYHRRAVLAVARHIPTVQRIHTACYSHHDPDTGADISRDTWWHTDSSWRVTKEHQRIQDGLRSGQMREADRSDGAWVPR